VQQTTLEESQEERKKIWRRTKVEGVEFECRAEMEARKKLIGSSIKQEISQLRSAKVNLLKKPLKNI
jgi:hypothetical protein